MTTAHTLGLDRMRPTGVGELAARAAVAARALGGRVCPSQPGNAGVSGMPSAPVGATAGETLRGRRWTAGPEAHSRIDSAGQIGMPSGQQFGYVMQQFVGQNVIDSATESSDEGFVAGTRDRGTSSASTGGGGRTS